MMKGIINEIKMLTDNDIVIFMALGNDWDDVNNIQYYKDLINFVNREEFNGLVRVVANLEYFGNGGSEMFHVSSNRCSDGLDCKYLIAAPGTNICSILPNKEVGVRTGTSMATPVVVGAYALLRGAFPNKRAIEILDLIDESARKVDLDGEVLGHEYGVGIIDIESAVNLAAEKGWTVKKGWFKKLIEFLFF
jgi:subtilisin family serine protease